MTKIPKSHILKSSAIAFLFCVASLPATVGGPAHADPSEQANALLKTMSDYMSGLQQISFDYDANLEIVTPDLQKIGLASSGALSLNRPSQIRMTRLGGFVDAELAYDGTTLGLIGKNQNAFAKVETVGSIDDLIDTLRHDFGFSVPAADLLSSDPFGALTFNVTETNDLGSGVINGRECDHLAFRTEETDWQIWIAQGVAPFPCRMTITSKLMSQGPEYRVDITNWKTGDDVATDDFQIKVSADAQQVTPAELFGLDEVSGLIAEGANR
jgi:hypothetical protein